MATADQTTEDTRTGSQVDPAYGLSHLVTVLPFPARLLASDGGIIEANDAYRRMFVGGQAELSEIHDLIRRALTGEVVHVPHPSSGTGGSTPTRTFVAAPGAQTVIEIVAAPSELRLGRLGAALTSAEPKHEFAKLGSWEQSIGTPEDPNVHPLTWSDEVYRIFGYEPGEIEAKSETFYRLVHPEDRELVREAVYGALEEGEDYSVEHRIVLPTGEVRWVREQSIIERDAEGQPTKMIGTILDITEGKRIEEVLRETEQNLRKIIDLIPQAIYCKDAEGRLLFANKGFEAITGLSGEQLARASQKDWCETQEQADRYHHEDLEVIRTGVSIFVPDEVFRDSLGRTHILQTVKVPFAVAGTHKPAVLGISLEITELKNIQNQLEERNALFSGIMESTDEPIFALDRQGICTQCNSAYAGLAGRVVGPSHRIGSDPLDLFSKEEDRALFRSWIQRALSGERLVEEYFFEPVDAWFEVSLNPIRNSSNEVVGVAGFMKNVTAKRAALQAIRELNLDLERRVDTRTSLLEQANKELESFAYSISHDLRSPLRAIDGFSEILAAEFGDQLDEEAKSHLSRVRKASQRMGELIDGLLAFSRLGRQAIVCKKFSTAQLVGEALDELAPVIRGRDIEFKIGQLPACSADRILIRTVFANLIENAIKFTRTRKSAVIEIGTTERNGQTVWFVRDNGVGFDMKYAEQLFGVFSRLHRPEEFEGTGVGLALVQRIILRHGGEIWAESEPELGACFYFTFGRVAEVEVGEGLNRNTAS